MNDATGAMAKVFSVDDLVGGLWRLGGTATNGGMPRNDSEAAFQEFLKRIPSASNLAAAANQMDSASAAQLQHQLQGATSASGISGMLPCMSIGDLQGAASIGGMHRVPSLDFLKQLSAMQQLTGGTQQGVKIEVPGHAGPLASFSAADLANLNANAAIQSALSVPALNTFHPVAAQAAHAAAAAAALQLNQLSRYTAVHAPSQHGRGGGGGGGGGHSGPSSDPDTDNDDDGGDRSDPKKTKSRANRMLSNRESARRSRRRKQEHLGKLEYEINILNDEKKEWGDRFSALEQRCLMVEGENKRFREENERQRGELQALRAELKENNSHARNGYEKAGGEQPGSESNKRHKPDAPVEEE